MIWPSLVQLSMRNKRAEAKRLAKLQHEMMHAFALHSMGPPPEAMHGAADEFGGSDFDDAFPPGEMPQNVGGPYR